MGSAREVAETGVPSTNVIMNNNHIATITHPTSTTNTKHIQYHSQHTDGLATPACWAPTLSTPPSGPALTTSTAPPSQPKWGRASQCRRRAGRRATGATDVGKQMAAGRQER